MDTLKKTAQDLANQLKKKGNYKYTVEQLSQTHPIPGNMLDWLYNITSPKPPLAFNVLLPGLHSSVVKRNLIRPIAKDFAKGLMHFLKRYKRNKPSMA